MFDWSPLLRLNIILYVQRAVRRCDLLIHFHNVGRFFFLKKKNTARGRYISSKDQVDRLKKLFFFISTIKTELTICTTEAQYANEIRILNYK